MSHEIGGSGVALEPDGSEPPLTPEELMETLDMPDVEYRDDGTVWVYYRSKAKEITDRFNSDGVCFVQLRDGKEILYLTVKYKDGFSASSSGFVQPDDFHTKRPD